MSGLEVLGAVASAVTLVGVAAKGVDFLRQIPEIQSDFSELCREIDLIKAICDRVEQRTDQSEKASVAADKTRLVSQTTTTLEEIRSQLEQVKNKCEHLTAEGKSEARKRKWIIREGKISALLAKVQAAKLNLILAMNSEAAQNSVEVMKLHGQLGAQLGGVDQKLHNKLLEIEKHLSHWPQILDVMVSIQSQVAANQTRLNSSRVQELDEDEDELISDPRGEGLKERSGLEATGYIATKTTLIALRKNRCSADCGCRCHAKPRSFSSPHWTAKLIGSLQLKLRPLEPRSKWELTCRCNNKLADLTVEWQPPDWPWVKLFLSARSYPLRCSLRPARVIPWLDGQLWKYRRLPVDDFVMAMRAGMDVFPDDQDETGDLFGDVLITENAYDILEVVLAEWKNVLPKQGFPSKTRHLAKFKMMTDELSEREIRLLSEMISYVADDGIEPETTPLHEAARAGSGVQEALEELQSSSQSQVSASEALNMLDAAGRAPLHWAAKYGHAEAAQELIDAGADLNRKSFEETTPLMVAAANNKTGVMRLLLSAGRGKCRIEEKDGNRETALHRAAFFGNSDAVQLLLAHGAATSARNFTGATPLHFAVESEGKGANPAEVQATLEPLLNAPGTNINAQDNSGRTPLFVAVNLSQHIALRHLIKTAGVSYTNISHDSENLLHYAALYSDLEVFQSLHHLELFGISTRLCDQYGYTPWDVFMCTLHAPQWQLPPMRKPTKDEFTAFVQLYRGVRDRNICCDLDHLESALDALATNDAVAASSHLSTLIQSKQDCGETDTASFYRGIMNNIRAGDREKSINVIKQDLEELRDELGTDPCDQPSPFTWLGPQTFRTSELSDNQDSNSVCSEESDKTWETISEEPEE